MVYTVPLGSMYNSFLQMSSPPLLSTGPQGSAGQQVVPEGHLCRAPPSPGCVSLCVCLASDAISVPRGQEKYRNLGLMVTLPRSGEHDPPLPS